MRTRGLLKSSDSCGVVDPLFLLRNHVHLEEESMIDYLLLKKIGGFPFF